MTKRLKIAQIVYSFDQGGLENGVVNLVNNMDCARFENYIVCFKKSGTLEKRLRSDIKVFEFNAKNNDISLPFKLARFFKKKGVDVIHARNWNTLFDSVVAAKMAGVPVIIHSYHGLLPFEKFPLRRRISVKILDIFIDRVFAVIDDTAQRWSRLNWLAKNRVKVIYNGVDTNKFSPQEKNSYLLAELNLKHGNFIVGIIGSLTPVKEHEVFLKAARYVSEKDDRCRFVIVGDGPLRQKLEDLSISLNIRNKVIFLGKRDDIPNMINCLDVLVSCSYLEGMSNAILEAMSSGKAVIATNTGGNDTLIENGKSGFLIPVGDCLAIAEKILELLNDPDLIKTIGANARKRICEKFPLTKMINNYSEAYLELFNKKCLRKKTILIVGAYPPPFGGMSLQAKTLYEHLLKDGLAAKCINAVPVLYGILNTPMLRTLIRLIKLQWGLLKNMPGTKTVYIFSCSYSYFFLVTIPTLLTGKMHRKKVIINYHGGLCEEFLKKWGFIAKPVLKLADFITVPSPYLQEVFKKFGLAAKVVHNIVDLEKFSFMERKTITPKIIVTRHHKPEYNVACAIKVFRNVKKVFPQATLTLVGSGEETNRLKEEAKSTGITDVTFMGNVPNEQLPNILEAHDIFLNTSIVDNVPVSLLEAFSKGLLVVSTPVGGIPYLVKNGWNGFLSDSYDPTDLAEKIISALRDPQKSHEIILNARNFVSQFTWNEVRKELLEIVEI